MATLGDVNWPCHPFGARAHLSLEVDPSRSGLHEMSINRRIVATPAVVDSDLSRRPLDGSARFTRKPFRRPKNSAAHQ